jgi:orotate phosphoribosyltransferase
MADGPFLDESTFLVWLRARAQSRDPYYYAIVDERAGALGFLALRAIRSQMRVIEVGRIILSPSLQCTTLVTEAHYLLAQYVFETLRFRRYEWKCDVLNTASCRAATRLGFTFEGVFRHHLIVKGRNCDTAWFATLDSNWRTHKEAFERWLAQENFDSDGRQKESLAAVRSQISGQPLIDASRQVFASEQYVPGGATASNPGAPDGSPDFTVVGLSAGVKQPEPQTTSRAEDQTAIQLLRQRIRDRGIVLASNTQQIISSSGKNQNWLIDLRRVFAEPDALQALATEFFRLPLSEDDLCLAGMEAASIPLLTALVLEGHRRGRVASMAVIRKERKHHGLGRNFEGVLGDNSVILVDDVLNSGQSVEKARVVLEQAGTSVRSVFVVIDYESLEGLAWRKQHGIEVHSLFKLADFGLELARPEKPLPTRRYRRLGHISVPGASPYHMVPKSAPLLVDSLLYFGTDQGSFFAVNTETGDRAWEFKTRVHHPKGIWSSAAHHQGRIYFGTYNGNVHCLDAKTGVEVWCQALCEWVGSSPLVLPHHGTLAIGLEYARPRASGSLCALSLDDGTKVWEQPLRVVQHGSAAHWRGGDLVVFGTNDHNVIALKASSGEKVWTFDTRRSVKYAPAIDEERGLVTFVSFDKSIYILDVATGAKVAEFETGDICYTTPLFAHGRLFCGSGDRNLYVIDLATMSLALKFDAGARVYCSPRLVGDSVIFGTNGGVVREMDPVSLKITGRFTVPDAVTNAIAVSPDGDRLFVPTCMNEIYAFGRS